jgi:hypothetical protein
VAIRAAHASVTGKLFNLADETLAYPPTNNGWREQHCPGAPRNPRLGGGRSVEAFVKIMDEVTCPTRFIDSRCLDRGCGVRPPDAREPIE